MKGRWYKRCGADFIHGTMMLTLEEKGAYSLCLDLIYDRGGPIPDDARWIAGVCGVSMRKWTAIRERLLSLGKLTSRDGLLSNQRADLDLAEAEIAARTHAENGAKGGRKSAEVRANAEPKHTENGTGQSNNSDLAQAGLKPKEESREEEKDPPSPPAGGRRGKCLLPEGWEVPPIADLPPQAKACAEKWPAGAYAAHGEEFVSFWRSRGRMMKDWRLTWAGRVVELHGRVLRDAKAEVTPPRLATPALPLDEQIAKAEQNAAFYERIGRDDDARAARRKAEQLRGQLLAA